MKDKYTQEELRKLYEKAFGELPIERGLSDRYRERQESMEYEMSETWDYDIGTLEEDEY